MENYRSSAHDDVAQEYSAIAGKDESSNEKALRIGLILHKIFTRLPTSFLLSSCSLVSKTWNTEVRKFVRDKRRCTAKKFKDTTACVFLQNLDQFCLQMVQNGRVIPFNYLRLDCSHICDDKISKSSNEILYSTLVSEMKLKGLAISGVSVSDCEYHKPLLTFLKNKATELRSLEVNSTAPFARFAADNTWSPQFRVLEDFRVGYVHWFTSSTPMRQRILWLLQDAPNLKRIFPTSLRCLKYVPEEVLAHVTLHGELKIDQQPDSEEVNLLYAVSRKSSGLQILNFYDPTVEEEDYAYGTYQDEPNGSSSEDESIAEEPLEVENRSRRYKHALERMLQSAQHSLETLETNTAYPLSQLSHPPLSNLSKLVLNWTGPNDWYDIASINFNILMPRLQEVELTIVGFVARDLPRAQLYSSNTVRTLSLKLKTDECNLVLLKLLFPNVSLLNLVLKNYWPNWWTPRQKWTHVPVTEICANWPGLEELKITGPNSCLDQNYDADLCGISVEEVALLREQEDDYLRTVKIVPIKPCLLTLPKLRDFWLVEDLFIRSYSDYAREHPQGFVSRVTQLVGFTRNPKMNVCLPCFTQ